MAFTHARVKDQRRGASVVFARAWLGLNNVESVWRASKSLNTRSQEVKRTKAWIGQPRKSTGDGKRLRNNDVGNIQEVM